MKRILADLRTLQSPCLSDIVAYNEHNHLTEETLAAEKRRAIIVEAENKLKERHDHIDRNLTNLQAKLAELTKEKQAREVQRNLPPPPLDPNEMAVEEATTAHQANVQRVIAVEVRFDSVDPDCASYRGSFCCRPLYKQSHLLRGIPTRMVQSNPSRSRSLPQTVNPCSYKCSLKASLSSFTKFQ